MPITLTRPETERRAGWWLDVVVLLGVGAVVFGLCQVAAQWRHPLRAAVDIDLSLRSLPRYTFFTFVRGWIAYFLPGLEFALVALFPRSNTGLELACILSIFLGQVWNMTFSYYDSLRGTPADFRMLGKLYNCNWWNRFWRVELPFGAQGLLYNSMVSMAGGWFFLIVCEAFSSGNKDFRVPGVGSYMKAAMDQGNVRAEIAGVVAMGVIILVIDRLIWWPLVVWSRKFKLDDFGGNRPAQTGLQLWLARSHAMHVAAGFGHALKHRLLPPPAPPSAATSLIAPGTTPPPPARMGRVVYVVLIALLVAVLAWGGLRLAWLIGQVHLADWAEMLRDSAASFARVLTAVVLGTLWTVPFGIWIGLNPKLSGRLQPFIQFVASFPAPMLYPWLLSLVLFVHGTLQWGSVLLILFGTQWYILFNVAGAAAAIPNDMLSCADILHLSGWRRWTKFLLPSVMPGLVIGWITAAGGAWNATIVAEAVSIGPKNYEATGLGDYINNASNAGNFPKLAASALLMAAVVVTINRTLWKRLQTIANDRCRFLA